MQVGVIEADTRGGKGYIEIAMNARSGSIISEKAFNIISSSNYNKTPRAIAIQDKRR